MLEKFTNNVKKVIGVGAVAVGSMVSSPAEASLFVGADGQPQSDGGRGMALTPDQTKSIDVAKGLQPALNTKFAQQLTAKDFSNIEVHLKPGSTNDKMTFIINIFHKTTPSGRVIEVDIDISISSNRYAMDELLSGAVSKELSK